MDKRRVEWGVVGVAHHLALSLPAQGAAATSLDETDSAAEPYTPERSKLRGETFIVLIRWNSVETLGNYLITLSGQAWVPLAQHPHA